MAEAKLFSIGEVAKLFHVSVSSLRHYEAAGLLQPEYISPDSGYRYYSPRQFEVLNTLRQLQSAKTTELDKSELVVCPACRLVWVEDALNIRGFLDMEAPIRRLY